VVVVGKHIDVEGAAGRRFTSNDSGATFTAAPTSPVKGTLPGMAHSGADTWIIDAAGHVLHSAGAAPASLDPGTPDLGEGAHLIAAPAAASGIVVAVAGDGTVWRRGQDGDWKRALLLLPQSLAQGVPRITSLTAFTQPLTVSVYLGTDGYAVLDSTDGGDDWIRAGPGLPDSVYALTTDPSTRSLYAGTSDGLWVHMLQMPPAPPAYQDAQLVWRWLGIGAITLIASGLTLVGLVRLLPRTPP
jgi:hypothetical protein